MWQFFGRKEILSELKFLLEFEEKPEDRSFSTLLILGRRGVGKTELLSQIEQRVPSNLPYVYVELPDPDKIPDSGDVAIDLLIKEASRSGLELQTSCPNEVPTTVLRSGLGRYSLHCYVRVLSSFLMNFTTLAIPNSDL